MKAVLKLKTKLYYNTEHATVSLPVLFPLAVSGTATQKTSPSSKHKPIIFQTLF